MSPPAARKNFSAWWDSEARCSPGGILMFFAAGQGKNSSAGRRRAAAFANGRALLTRGSASQLSTISVAEKSGINSRQNRGKLMAST